MCGSGRLLKRLGAPHTSAGEAGRSPKVQHFNEAAFKRGTSTTNAATDCREGSIVFATEPAPTFVSIFFPRVGRAKNALAALRECRLATWSEPTGAPLNAPRTGKEKRLYRRRSSTGRSGLVESHATMTTR